MARRLSTVVGYARDRRDTRRPVYRALEAQRCGGCDAEITAGELFVRRAHMSGIYLNKLVPWCRLCEPFAFAAEDAAMLAATGR